MNLIDNISDEPHQVTRLVLDDGTVAQLELNYLPAVQRWSFDLIYGDLEIRTQGLSTHPNLLRQWKNIIPFGLACQTSDDADPVAQDDFTSGRAALYLLNDADVLEVERTILGAA